MKKSICVLFFLFTFSCTVFAQAQKHEIQLEDEKGKASFIKLEKMTVSAKLSSVKSFLKKQYLFDQHIDFKVKTEQQKSLVNYQKLQQYYKGIKVAFGEMVVSSKENYVKSLNGRFVAINDLSVTPQLTEQAALNAALNQIGSDKYAWQDSSFEAMLKNEQQNPKASYYPNGELVIVEKNLFDENSIPTLAYLFNIYSLSPFSRNEYYVDANNGEIVFTNPIMMDAQAETRYSGTRSITTQQSGSTYRLVDLTRGGGITTWNADNLNIIPGDPTAIYTPALHFTDANDNWTAAEFNNANKDNAALDAHWGAEMTYDYFLQRHNRNSIDNAGYALNNYVHINIQLTTPWLQAVWDGQRMLYGDGNETTVNPFVSLDIVAHEIGHGFCNSTAGLVYAKESGAINESLSDIWGAMVEFFAAPEKQTYLLGEEPTITVDAFRSMINPKLFNQPDTYGGTNWFDVNGCTNGSDNCGVHTNSGVMNRWFYLLAEGGSGTNDKGVAYNITGIGKLKAANIVYLAEDSYFNATTNYPQARATTIAAAGDLYGVSSTESLQVALAWYAVGVGSNPQSSHYITGPTQLTPGLSGYYSINPYYNATNYVWTIPSGCATSYCWAILSGQGTSGITIRAGKLGIQDITCRIYAGNTFVSSQYITVNVQSGNSGGGGDPCDDGSLTSLYGVIYPPPCNGAGLIAEIAYFKHIVIYDILGQVVKEGVSVEQIDTNDLHRGIYIVQAILNNGQLVTQKILK